MGFRLRFSLKSIHRLEHFLYLVAGLEHEFYDFPYIGNFIIPTDELIFFRGVGLNHQPVLPLYHSFQIFPQFFPDFSTVFPRFFQIFPDFSTVVSQILPQSCCGCGFPPGIEMFVPEIPISKYRKPLYLMVKTHGFPVKIFP